MFPTIFVPDTDLESARAQRIRQIMFQTPPAGVAGVQMGMAERPDSVETLRAARVPLVMIAGSQDQIVKRAMLDKLAESLPDLRFVWIDGAGHMPMVEQPTATSAALRAFLQSAP
jgi:pimeloyl-ACP methyl ester carboxylesterase